MADDTAIEMFVGGLVLDPNTQAPVVILKDETGENCIPIWIGAAEATSIASAIKQIELPRPLTHDLLYSVVVGLMAQIERVLITDLRDSTYFAELVVAHGEQALVFDSRPSDAIAIALRAAAPIYVAAHVVEQAKMSMPKDLLPTAEGTAEEGPLEEAEGGADAEGEATAEAELDKKDFRVIDKEQWTEMLDSLDPDDFKYKM